ncbi:MAG: translation initiation factor IF-2, partial [Clostridium sp.]|nr:translation initiation factor IF-2 [Clostridium sp.]
LNASHRVSLEDLYSQIKEGTVKELAIIVKADVQGSVEAIRQSLEKLSTDDVKVRVIHGAVGAITETDITLATASNAIVIGFNVRPDSNAIAASEREKVDVKTYRIIYDAIEDVKSAMVGMLEPEYKEVVLGKAEVRETYKISNVGTIAGCYVLDGKILRNSDIRVIRDGIVIFESSLASLKRFKDDVKEVATGYECGLSVEKFNDIKEGDIIESFKIEAIKRKEL